MANYYFLLLAVGLTVLLPSVAAQGNGTHHQYCFVCETIINVAKHEKPKTIDQLRTMLTAECNSIAAFFHDTAACLQIFNNGTNLQTIWTMLQANAHAKKICEAIGMCKAGKYNTQAQTESSSCKQCLKASRTFYTLSKSGLSEELMGLCQTDVENDCLGVVAMDIDLLYSYYQTDGHSNAACYHLNIC